MSPEDFSEYRQKFTCKFPQAIEFFDENIEEIRSRLTQEQIEQYFQTANFLCSIGQGVEPVLAFLKYSTDLIEKLGVDVAQILKDFGYKLARSPDKNALVPFFEAMQKISSHLQKPDDLQEIIGIIENFIESTRTVIHAHQLIHSSEGLIPLLKSLAEIMFKLDIEGLKNFIEYGTRNYRDTPEQLVEYFSLKSHDAKSIILRERKGTTFQSVENKLYLFLQSHWNCEFALSAYSTGIHSIINPEPYLDEEMMALPDVYDDTRGENGELVSGIMQYYATLSHLAAHSLWSEKLMADNYAPQLRLFVSVFEDARVDTLAIRKFPGLKKIFLALHPYPEKNVCDDLKVSTLRFRASRLSRALLDNDFKPEDKLMSEFRNQFKALLSDNKQSSTAEMSKLATDYFVKSRLKSDSLPDVYFENTKVHYRDDNRHIWYHYEEYDEADEVPANEYKNDSEILDIDSLPPRYYHEWDYVSESYRPDWNTVYERLHPSGDSSVVESLMTKHSDLAKRLKRLIEIMRPQNKTRIRFQEDGEELDLDIALRSFIDLKSGQVPDLRINNSYKQFNRNIAVMLLVDCSESLNNKSEETGQVLLELSQEALAITAWTMDQLDDKFAIAGFSSNTRNEVRYQHIKGFSENYDEMVKARISCMEAGYSTRMGAAMRHAAHYLKNQQAEKKLLLVLTDGEPADVDAKNPQTLIKDTKKTVEELRNDGIYSYCITLDKRADDYVHEIFENHFTVIDKVERLPETLPRVFLELTS